MKADGEINILIEKSRLLPAHGCHGGMLQRVIIAVVTNMAAAAAREHHGIYLADVTQLY